MGVTQEEIVVAPRRRPKTEIRDSDIQGSRILKAFGFILEILREREETNERGRDRQLHYDHYVGLLLFSFYTPVLESLRSIQRASRLNKVQQILGCSRASLGSLSEASSVFDPEILRAIIVELAGQIEPRDHSGRIPEDLRGLTAVDGTILRGFARMAWALWLGENGHGAKVHVSFDVLRGAVVNATLTCGSGSERKELRRMLEAGRLYVIDAGYADYSLFVEIGEAGSSFIGRIRDDASWEVLEERPVGEEARAAGIQRDLIVRLGSDKTRIDQPMRVVEIIPPEGGSDRRRERILLATDRMDLDVELVSLGYRYRWSVELFFRWFKCILGCRHLLSENQNGLTIQVYAGIIASLLIQIWTGRKPTKATLEIVYFYLTGMADESEFNAHVDELKKQG